MKINGVEFIKVRDAKAMESGWAYIKGDDIILDNEFENIPCGSILKLDDNHNIVDFEIIKSEVKPDTRIEQLKSLVGRKVKAKAGEGEIVGVDEFSIRAEVKIGDGIKHWNLPTVLDHLI
ncbi:hypothetical protein [Ligilactobacillus agilis]|uniref:hypothetical protein n=1 Tax=Ligilactobacillus agilis TaxID=1601 RepID=UPI003F8A399A